MVLPTPDLSHLTGDDYQHVYEPAEDSFLLLDTLEQDAERLKDLNPLICVEVGSGSGVILTGLAKLLLQDRTFSLATDINSRACVCTTSTLERNGVSLYDAVTDDMILSLSNRLHSSVDVLIFNPPYVPCPVEEVISGDAISQSWAGGQDGREIIDRLLPKVGSLLSDTGLFYIVLIKENKPSDVCSLLAAQGLMGEQLLTRRAGNELLHVFRFSRQPIRSQQTTQTS